MKALIHHISQPVTLRRLALAIFIIVLCLILHFAGLDSLLRFDRQQIATGSIWLLLTGNFVHLGTGHLLMNMAGLVLIVVLVWQHFTWFEWVLITLVSSLTVGVGLYLRDPDVFWYVGFSGTLHGLILAGVLADLRVYPKSAALLLILIVAKLVWEQVSGALPGSESLAGGSVVVNAHLYGAIGGAVIGVLLIAYRQIRNSSAASG